MGEKGVSRRGFLRGATALALGAAISGCVPRAARVIQPTVAWPTAAATTPIPRPTPTSKVLTSVPSETPITVEPSPTTSEETPITVQTSPTATVGGPTPSGAAYLAVARGSDPETITRRAIAAIGGIERFVKPGYEVIVKPNICNHYHSPEYASTTNPEVVATLVKLCLGAGAKRVRVMDLPFTGPAETAYARSGIEEAVKRAGGQMELMARMRYERTEIPDGVDLKSWDFYQPMLEADLVINVPIAKHHGLARLTLGGKNLMGVILDRGQMHRNLGQRIADITSLVRPQLTVVDAVRILVDNGPTGGSLDDVKQADTVIASHDIVAADAYATTLFGLAPSDISYVVASARMGLGTMDLKSIKIVEVNV